MDAATVEVTCPTCFEVITVPAPSPDELPTEVECDYDCEVCCRPMVIRFTSGGGSITGEAIGLDD